MVKERNMAPKWVYVAMYVLMVVGALLLISAIIGSLSAHWGFIAFVLALAVAAYGLYCENRKGLAVCAILMALLALLLAVVYEGFFLAF